MDDRTHPLDGDILEMVLSHVALVDLVPASHVSDSWKRAISSSLRYVNSPKPWLLLHSQTIRSPYTTTTRAYDPRSDVWVEVSVKHVSSSSALRAPHSGLLYMLSPSQLSFSTDPLHLTWNHAPAPMMWRADPVVAAVGHRLVVAGGGCDFDDDPLAVEIYNLKTRTWESCDEMPSVIRDCSASECLSVAVAGEVVYVMEKSSGLTHCFDPVSKIWSGPYNLRPHSGINFSIIESVNDTLVLIGVVNGDAACQGKSVKLWTVGSDMSDLTEIGQMPPNLVKEMKGEKLSCTLPSIDACSSGNFLYLYNSQSPEKVFWCDLEAASGRSKWGSVSLSTAEANRNRVVFSSSNVGIHDLETAMAAGNRRFSVMEN